MRTRGSQLISGGPGFERKCSCNTESFLPSLSCPQRGGGGTRVRGWQGRGRGLSVRPQHLVGVCTLTQAHVRACTHTHRKPPLHTSPVTKLCPSSFHSFHWMTSQPCPRPVQPVLPADGVALLTKLSCSAQDQPSIVAVASKILCPLLAPPSVLSPHCLSAVPALPTWSP